MLSAPDTPHAQRSVMPGGSLLPGSVRLPDWGVIRATGEDARSFLHGQLTQDVLGLEPDRTRLAGLCSATGRLLATFLVWRDVNDDVMLACSADLVPAMLKRLSMYVLRAKCKLSDDSRNTILWGLSADPELPSPGLCVRTERGILMGLTPALLDQTPVSRGVLATQGADSTAAAQRPGDAPEGARNWAWLEVHSGVARIVAATSDQFVPQTVNLEATGGVSFQKGCYPGQEVVARSQYRGTLKRRGFILHSGARAHPGQEVFHSDDPGQPAGMVVLGASKDDVGAAFVQLKLQASGSGSLHLGSPDGPVMRIEPLPYAVSREVG